MNATCAASELGQTTANPVPLSPISMPGRTALFPAPHLSPGGVPGAAATKNEVLAHCRERLAGFKRPKRLIIGEPAKTSTGKIRKNELRDLACPTT